MSRRVLRYETWLASAAALAMAGFLGGAASWMISGTAAPRGLFRVGAIDYAGLFAMALAVAVATAAARRTVRASASWPASGARPGR
jgi:hypothetical protein